MFTQLAQKLFGSANERFIKKLEGPIQKINSLEASFSQLRDADLQAKTIEFRERLSKGETLDDLLPEAFATVREASKRVLNMRHFDVQLKGGMILHKGMITEMRTGEGKTLVATLPVYLNALSGTGVHVVTVNDYLAKRDSSWMGKIYEFLGLTVGCITHELSDFERQMAYRCDITYATNNELGFDYLRDNMKFRLEERVQRPFNFAIVDEVDSILIDEARTPLIISGAAEDSSDLYMKVDAIIPSLIEGDFEKDEKSRSVTLTEQGIEHVEELLRQHGLLGAENTLYDLHNVSLVHHVNQALKAHKLFSLDVDYMIMDGQLMLIDEFTGRVMEGRRYSEGLHQALEAKEKVEIQQENQTLASITYQNYFRLYPKLAGMTGTALTEASEFNDIYKLEVIDVPTNKPVARIDHDDEVYRTAREKYEAIVTLIEECRGRQQPVLVGTVSIEKSEYLSEFLKARQIPHAILNAKHHEKEATIIADAGVPGAVTIATNMAGRGTDIKLGGNLEMRMSIEAAHLEDPKEIAKLEKKIAADIEVQSLKTKEAGGLYVIGTERHESRRIDNQLRGRSGRQGDPGASKFFLSLEDDLMRIFGSDRLDAWLQKLGLQEGEAIIHPWINKALAKAQQKVEARNYDIRKQLLKYDDVMNDQRKVIYEQRREIMQAEDTHEIILGMREDVVDRLIEQFIPPHALADDWNVGSLHEETLRIFGLDLPFKDWAEEEGIAETEMRERLDAAVNALMDDKERMYSPSVMRMAEKSMLLRLLDQNWKDHLMTLDQLRQGINLRAYGQRDPLNEYKGEAFEMFQSMLVRLSENVTSVLSHLQIGEPDPQMVRRLLDEAMEDDHDGNMKLNYTLDEYDPGKDEDKVMSQDPETWGATPRNAPCPCGSGERYKQCHGKIEE